ncbi:MAG: DPP IV N-terminal domain-containing protein, partial [Candidatus Poribacteria bacterium]|nr:DPP IV N-terminal domain-containing protein [Candidatus Poribacteria bacterium]
KLIKKPEWETDPSWSPDGRKIAFRSHSHERSDEIYVMDADGGDIERLTRGGFSKYMPAWSPDGEHIAYVSNHRIWVMDSDGKKQRPISENGSHRHPTWSPDSGTIAFQSRVGHSFSIFTVDVEAGGMDPLLQVRDQDDSNPDWFHPGGLLVTPGDSHIAIWGRLKNIGAALR